MFSNIIAGRVMSNQFRFDVTSIKKESSFASLSKKEKKNPRSFVVLNLQEIASKIKKISYSRKKNIQNILIDPRLSFAQFE